MYKVNILAFYAVRRSEHDVKVAQDHVASPTDKTSNKKQQRVNIRTAVPRGLLCEVCLPFRRTEQGPLY